MVNEKISNLVQELSSVASEGMATAKKALSGLPEGETKKDLEKLLQKASSGNANYSSVQKDLQKIIYNAGKH